MIENRTFTSLQEFLDYTIPFGIVYFFAYDNEADLQFIADFPKTFDFESVVCLRRSESVGFLGMLDRKPKRAFLGGFTKGAFIDIAKDSTEVARVVENCRRFHGG